MVDLLSLVPDAARTALAQWLAQRREPAYRARQVLPRVWERPVASWDEATELPAALRRALTEVLPLDAALKPTNVVFMGMGEPLLNWDAVDRALTILNHAEGVGIGARHITVSTVGILPNLAKLAQRPEQFRLALSLHAPTPELRHELMPIEKKYTLPAVIAALARFRRRVTLEYVRIGGKNAALERADQ